MSMTRTSQLAAAQKATKVGQTGLIQPPVPLYRGQAPHRAAPHPGGLVRKPIFILLAAMVTLLGLTAPAYGAQETHFNNTAFGTIYCNGAECGSMSAVIDVRAVKDAPTRSWDSQGKIDLYPFKTAGVLRGTTVAVPTKVCTHLSMKAVASNNFSATSASFGDLPLYLDNGPAPVVVGRVATLSGYHCEAPATNRHVVRVLPTDAFVFFGGRSKVDSIKIRAKTTATWGTTTLNTGWTADRIVFDS